MADQAIDVSKLPLEVRAKLAELDLELSEGKTLFSSFLVGLGNGKFFDIFKTGSLNQGYFSMKLFGLHFNTFTPKH